MIEILLKRTQSASSPSNIKNFTDDCENIGSHKYKHFQAGGSL